jgi:hypothetical protein
MFRKVMQILESHHFRLPACRFALDLFDRDVLRKIVLDEEEDSSDSDEGEEEEATDSDGVEQDEDTSSDSESEVGQPGTGGVP